jgi:hypothetical protein
MAIGVTWRPCRRPLSEAGDARERWFIRARRAVCQFCSNNLAILYAKCAKLCVLFVLLPLPVSPLNDGGLASHLSASSFEKYLALLALRRAHIAVPLSLSE